MRVFGFALFLAVAGIVILAISVASKMGGNSGINMEAHFVVLNNHYLIGTGGYDNQGMNWIKAVARLTVVNLIALMPLWLVLLWKIYSVARSKKTISKDLFLSLSPLLTAIFFIAVLRNYFAITPGGGPVLIYGIVFSIRLLLDCHAEVQTTGARQFWVMTAIPVLAGFIYGTIVLAWLNVNAADCDSVLQLTKNHTPRSGIIFYWPPIPGSGKSRADFRASLTEEWLL